MVKPSKHIVIVRSSIIRLSSLSLESCTALVRVLAKHYAKVSVATVNNLSDLEELVSLRPDLVFLGMKYVHDDSGSDALSGDRIWLADYLDEQGIAYTGSNQLAHELELDKSLAKRRVRQYGLKTSNFQVIAYGDNTWHNPSLNFPLFVKPTNRGGGVGIDQASVVNNADELGAKVAAIAEELQADSLVEEFLPGREFSVAVFKRYDTEGYDIMPIELVAPADNHGIRMLSQQVKLSDTEQVLAVNESQLRQEVSTLALEVFMALGGRDYGRIDIRLDAQGLPNFLEANLIPSLIDNYGSFPKSCMLNIGLGHTAMILRITELGLLRSNNLKLNITDNISWPLAPTEYVAVA